MLPASFAAWVPVFMATPTSAWASAGASLVPSPVIATSLPLACSSLDQPHLGLGRGLGEEVVDARLAGDRRGGARVVAGDHDGADAHGAEAVEALADAALDHVLEVDDAEHARAVGDRQRRAALHRRSRRRLASTSVGSAPPSETTCSAPPRTAPLRMHRPPRSQPLIRVCAVKGMKVALAVADLAPAQAVTAPWPAPRSSAPRASRRRGWPTGRRRPAPPRRTPGDRDELGRHAVAQGDGAGLVQQQRVDVARRLDRAPAHREHVLAAAGDPCRRFRWRRAGRRWWSESGRPAAPPTAVAEMWNSRSRAPSGTSVAQASRKIERQADQQDVQRDLVGRLLPRARPPPARSCDRGTSRRDWR